MQDTFLPVYVHMSKNIPDYMAEKIRQFVDAGKVTVLPPAMRSQSASAFPRGGRGAIWYNKQIKGNK